MRDRTAFYVRWRWLDKKKGTFSLGCGKLVPDSCRGDLLMQSSSKWHRRLINNDAGSASGGAKNSYVCDDFRREGGCAPKEKIICY